MGPLSLHVTSLATFQCTEVVELMRWELSRALLGRLATGPSSLATRTFPQHMRRLHYYHPRPILRLEYRPQVCSKLL